MTKNHRKGAPSESSLHIGSTPARVFVLGARIVIAVCQTQESLVTGSIESHIVIQHMHYVNFTVDIRLIAKEVPQQRPQVLYRPHCGNIEHDANVKIVLSDKPAHAGVGTNKLLLKLRDLPRQDVALFPQIALAASREVVEQKHHSEYTVSCFLLHPRYTSKVFTEFAENALRFPCRHLVSLPYLLVAQLRCGGPTKGVYARTVAQAKKQALSAKRTVVLASRNPFNMPVGYVRGLGRLCE